jgi:hypothetical protein
MPRVKSAGMSMMKKEGIFHSIFAVKVDPYNQL